MSSKMDLHGQLKGPLIPLLQKACKHDYLLMMKVKIANFGMLIGLIKTSDEFQEEHSGTLLRALKTLTS